MRYGDLTSFQTGVAVPLFSLHSKHSIGIEALDELARTILITARPTKKNTIKSGLKRGSIISYYKSFGFNYLMDLKEELQNIGCTEGSSETLVDMFKFENKNIPEFIMKNAERIKTNLGRLKDESKELYIKVFLNNSILLK